MTHLSCPSRMKASASCPFLDRKYILGTCSRLGVQTILILECSRTRSSGCKGS
uniref:Uncharacterized protein n=1 Tax=Rhizophora mucronata TaxID=61149 RepID=A0A2P2P0H5_RHIMU